MITSVVSASNALETREHLGTPDVNGRARLGSSPFQDGGMELMPVRKLILLEDNADRQILEM